MCARTRYYMLVSSLPFLPRIRKAERLPINEARLEQRLRMLPDGDAEIVDRLRRFIQWQNQQPDHTDADIAARYEELLTQNPHPAVRAGIEFRMDLRTVLGAMRLRNKGQRDAPVGRVWGVGRWVRHIENNWNHPEFKLSHVFPWIPEANRQLKDGEAMALEEMAMNLVWDSLDRSAFGKPFQLEGIIAYLFKWDVLNRWLSYGTEPARTRFEALTTAMFPDNLFDSALAASPSP